MSLMFAGTALIALLPASHLSAQSVDGPYVKVPAAAERPVGDRVEAAGLVAIDPGWSLDRAGRAGYRLDRATLAYLRGGSADIRIETGANAFLSPLGGGAYHDGWTIGAGIERRILKRISARLEYRYADLGDGEGEGAFDRHSLLTGIAYRF